MLGVSFVSAEAHAAATCSAPPTCTGKQMLGWNGTAFVCKDLTCRTVTNEGGAPSFASHAQCAADEFVMTGGGECQTAEGNHNLCGQSPSGKTGILHFNGVSGNGWAADCILPGDIGEVCSRAWALCCKYQ